MTAIDREPGGSTMIRISNEVRDIIESNKVIPRESHNDCIKRVFVEHRNFKNVLNKFYLLNDMYSDLYDFALNDDIADSPIGEYRDIWLAAHPGETLVHGEEIHHINGNHDDNRPENLQKLSMREHKKIHALMQRNSMIDLIKKLRTISQT